MGPIALFNKYRLFSSSGKEIEEIDNAHDICLMHKLLPSSRDSDDLPIDFHQIKEAREAELTNNKTTKRNYVTFYLKDVFRFAEHQGYCTHGLGFKLKLQLNSDNHALSHLAQAKFVLAGGVNLDDISLYSALYSEYIK